MLLKNRTDFVPDHRPERFGIHLQPARLPQAGEQD